MVALSGGCAPAGKFIPGEPMKRPDEGVRRRFEQLFGSADLHRRALDITTTLSAKVGASTWSWVT